jgi:hypothetical protein
LDDNLVLDFFKTPATHTELGEKSPGFQNIKMPNHAESQKESVKHFLGQSPPKVRNQRMMSEDFSNQYFGNQHNTNDLFWRDYPPLPLEDANSPKKSQDFLSPESILSCQKQNTPSNSNSLPLSSQTHSQSAPNYTGYSNPTAASSGLIQTLQANTLLNKPAQIKNLGLENRGMNEASGNSTKPNNHTENEGENLSPSLYSYAINPQNQFSYPQFAEDAARTQNPALLYQQYQQMRQIQHFQQIQQQRAQMQLTQNQQQQQQQIRYALPQHVPGSDSNPDLQFTPQQHFQNQQIRLSQNPPNSNQNMNVPQINMNMNMSMNVNFNGNVNVNANPPNTGALSNGNGNVKFEGSQNASIGTNQTLSPHETSSIQGKKLNSNRTKKRPLNPAGKTNRKAGVKNKNNKDKSISSEFSSPVKRKCVEMIQPSLIPLSQGNEDHHPLSGKDLQLERKYIIQFPQIKNPIFKITKVNKKVEKIPTPRKRKKRKLSTIQPEPSKINPVTPSQSKSGEKNEEFVVKSDDGSLLIYHVDHSDENNITKIRKGSDFTLTASLSQEYNLLSPTKIDHQNSESQDSNLFKARSKSFSVLPLKKKKPKKCQNSKQGMKKVEKNTSPPKTKAKSANKGKGTNKKNNSPLKQKRKLKKEEELGEIKEGSKEDDEDDEYEIESKSERKFSITRSIAPTPPPSSFALKSEISEKLLLPEPSPVLSNPTGSDKQEDQLYPVEYFNYSIPSSQQHPQPQPQTHSQQTPTPSQTQTTEGKSTHPNIHILRGDSVSESPPPLKTPSLVSALPNYYDSKMPPSSSSLLNYSSQMMHPSPFPYSLTSKYTHPTALQYSPSNINRYPLPHSQTPQPAHHPTQNMQHTNQNANLTKLHTQHSQHSQQQSLPQKTPFNIYPHVYQKLFNVHQQHLQKQQKVIGTISMEERNKKIEKYREKKKTRTWGKKISYDCRKRVAQNRLRVKGRFVTKEKAIMMEEGVDDVNIGAQTSGNNQGNGIQEQRELNLKSNSNGGTGALKNENFKSSRKENEEKREKCAVMKGEQEEEREICEQASEDSSVRIILSAGKEEEDSPDMLDFGGCTQFLQSQNNEKESDYSQYFPNQSFGMDHQTLNNNIFTERIGDLKMSTAYFLNSEERQEEEPRIKAEIEEVSELNRPIFICTKGPSYNTTDMASKHMIQ